MDTIIPVFETLVQYNCSYKSLYTKTRAEIVTLYIESSRSVELTQHAYRRKYGGKEHRATTLFDVWCQTLLNTEQWEIDNMSPTTKTFQ
nr:unnamed protein product [Callosobruchus analis]